MPPVIETGAANPPTIGSVTGTGISAGFAPMGPMNEAAFGVDVVAGASPGTSGGFTLTFGSATAQTIVAFADAALGAVTLTPGAGNTIAVAWTGAALVAGRRYKISFQWASLT